MLRQRHNKSPEDGDEKGPNENDERSSSRQQPPPKRSSSGSSSTSSSSALFGESWEDIITSTRVVNTRDEALAMVVPPNENGGSHSPSPLLLLKQFWWWNVPLVARVWFVLIVIVRSITLVMPKNIAADAEREIIVIISDIAVQILQETASCIGLPGDLSLSGDKSIIWIMFSIGSRFALATIFLLAFRICQRLSWRTSELKTFPNVKDDNRYLNDALLKKAWELAASHYTTTTQGWKDPTTCSDFKEGLGGGSIVMQPRPGYCGLATLNSTLRSFGGGTNNNKPRPYLSVHKYPRYVTLEEMVQMIEKVVITGHNDDSSFNDNGKSKSKWEKGGGSRVESMQVLGGGSSGFASLEQFKQALRQLSHPTQPARIIAIYHRSPLFFCDAGRSTLLSRVASFGMVHWSPVLAYLEEEDLVLVMDVNHTYGPKGYLLPTERFYDSVNTRDVFTGNYHGLVLLRPPPPKGEATLLTSPLRLADAFIKMKKAYYQHQAAGSVATAKDILESDEDGYNPLQGNENQEKLVRVISSSGYDDNDDEAVSAVVSSHPATFVNEIFLESRHLPTLDSIRSMVNVCAKLHVPARVSLRGFEASAARKVHKVLTAAGMVQLTKSMGVYFLNLHPETVNEKKSQEMIPLEHAIVEVMYQKGDSNPEQVQELGKLIATSWKIPGIVRRGMNPAEFYMQAYQTFEHGHGDLKHFVCIERKSGEMASCVALFCDRERMPDVAVIFNVCTDPNHRRKGLGKAMTMCAIEDARKIGCKQVVLEASPEGQPLYESMGFIKTVEDVGEGLYISLSTATEDVKWKIIFRLFEMILRIKNGGLMWYFPKLVRSR